MSTKTKGTQRKKIKKRRGNAQLAALMSEKREFRCPTEIYELMTENHQDVLQNIEMAAVMAWRGDTSIDDRDVAQALKAGIRGNTVEDGAGQRVQEMLKDARELRTDTPDELWRNGLLVVLKSVGNHSSLKPGEREYLRFVDDFLP